MRRAAWYATLVIVFVAVFVATLFGHLEWAALGLAPLLVAWAGFGVREVARKGRPAGMGPVVVAVVLLALAVTAVVYAFFHVREMLGWPLAYIAIAAISLITATSLLRRAERRAKSRSAAIVEDVHSIRPELRLTGLGLFAIIVCVAAMAAIVTPIISLFVLGAVAAWMGIWLPRRMRTRRADFEILVGCSTQRAFDFVTDQRNAPRYMPETEVAELLTPPPIGLGSVFRQRTKTPDLTDPLLGTIPGAVVATEERITAFDRPRHAVFEIVGGNGSEIVYTFEPAGGDTDIRATTYVVFDLVAAWLGTALQPAMRRTEEFLSGRRAAWYGRLKEILEAEAVSG